MKIKALKCLLSLGFALLVGGAVEAKSSKEYIDIQITPTRNPAAEANNELRADAAEIADLLNIRPVVEMLRTHQRSGKDMCEAPKDLQSARLMCLWRMFVASEEVRKVVAQINFDIAVNNVHLETLTNRKRLTNNLINTFNFTQSGVLGIVKNSLAIAAVYPIFRQEIAMTSFGMSGCLPIINMYAPNLIYRRTTDGANMLSHVTDPGYKPAYANQSYLWKYFNSPIPGSASKEPRREIILKHWEAIKGLSATNEKQKDLMDGTNEKTVHEGLKTVGQRIEILHDFKTHIEEFDGALFELHQAITNIQPGEK
ncbi:MAG: hypothetical protein KIT34_16340 [Cyanobacteria bacterium TGS_CYA1]|nr:hypothetical protein [Cyanobacteria bacterium TGS_CYA1]